MRTLKRLALDNLWKNQDLKPDFPVRESILLSKSPSNMQIVKNILIYINAEYYLTKYTVTTVYWENMGAVSLCIG